MRSDHPAPARRAFLCLALLMLAFGVLVQATATGLRAGGSHRVAGSITPRAHAGGGERSRDTPPAGDHGGGAQVPATSNAAGPRELTPEEIERFELGRSLYATCATCHGANGEGVGENPPLRAAPIANGPPGRFARILIDGMTGPVVVNGKLYNGVMPASQANEDEDLAAVMTFVRRSFGNKADPVTPESVAKVKAETEDHAGRAWTAIELEKVE